jgi:hypothetical protein
MLVDSVQQVVSLLLLLLPYNLFYITYTCMFQPSLLQQLPGTYMECTPVCMSDVCPTSVCPIDEVHQYGARR